MPDPRSKRGTRYPFAGLLAACFCTVWPPQGAALRRMAECLANGGTHGAPAATTIQRLFQRVDPDALDTALAAWAAARVTADVIAIDGKELRSSKRDGHDRVHLMAATADDTGAVVRQIDVMAKTNEIPRLAALPRQLDGHRSLSMPSTPKGGPHG